MAKYILSTLEALAAGDISAPAAIYSLTAHIVATGQSGGAPVLRDDDIKPYVSNIVQAVAVEKISALTASRYLIITRDKLSAGTSPDEVFKSAPGDYADNP